MHIKTHSLDGVKQGTKHDGGGSPVRHGTPSVWTGSGSLSTVQLVGTEKREEARGGQSRTLGVSKVVQRLDDHEVGKTESLTLH